jgi:hypothetical protein
MPTIARKSLLAAVLLCATAACTDLTVTPQSTVSASNLFKNDPNSYKDYIAKLYAGLGVSGQQGPAGSADIQGIDEGFSQYMRLYWEMQELPTDEAVIGWGDAGSQELNTQLWGSSNQFLGAMYSRVFFQVSLANEFLRQTTDAQLSSRGVTGQLAADVKQYRAEARFLRALSYWHGMDLFGNIPLVTEADPIGTTAPQQATRAQIFAFIESELKALRPDLPPAGTGQYGRADQGAVDMLLAKLYINAKVYTGTDRSADALAAASNVINSGAYQLDPNYRHPFMADNNTSKEIIFAVPQDEAHQQSYGGTTFLIHAEIGGSMDPSKYGSDGGWWGLRTRPEFVALFPGDSTVDHRALFYTDGQSLQINNLTNFTDGYALPKFTNVTSAGTHTKGDFMDTDFPMFRLADAYLIYAEAVLRGGGGSTAQALAYVNALRTRAYGDASGNITAAQLTLPFILDERGRELYWEADRRTDLIRFGDFSTAGVWQWKGNVKAGKTTEAFRDLYPLPSSEIVTNPNLKQNTGY